MIDFLQKRLKELEKELQELYIGRSRAGVESIGGYDNQIDKLKKEMLKIKNEISDLEIIEHINTPTKNDNTKNKIIDLIGQGDLKEALETLKDFRPNDIQTVLLNARFNKNHTDYTIYGAISREDYALELNKISAALLSFVTAK